MMRALGWFTALAISLAAIACDDQGKADTSGGGDKSGSSASTAAASDEGAGMKEEEIPVPADFEEEAEKEITADNLESELDKLEKEIDG